eukprot:scaffold347653_cov20-Prasinocladus_malaysianus.AAC.1
MPPRAEPPDNIGSRVRETRMVKPYFLITLRSNFARGVNASGTWQAEQLCINSDQALKLLQT